MAILLMLSAGGGRGVRRGLRPRPHQPAGPAAKLPPSARPASRSPPLEESVRDPSFPLKRFNTTQTASDSTASRVPYLRQAAAKQQQPPLEDGRRRRRPPPPPHRRLGPPTPLIQPHVDKNARIRSHDDSRWSWQSQPRRRLINEHIVQPPVDKNAPDEIRSVSVGGRRARRRVGSVGQVSPTPAPRLPKALPSIGLPLAHIGASAPQGTPLNRQRAQPPAAAGRGGRCAWPAVPAGTRPCCRWRGGSCAEP